VKLERETLLQSAPELRITRRPSGELEIERHGELYRVGRGALPAIEVFSRPTTLSSALPLLVPASAGKVEGLEIIETVFGLLNAGILRRVDGQATVPATKAVGADPLPMHIHLLNDRVRTSSFLAAIADVVRPGDVVLDIGAGTGILSVAAARAGARHVYAVESGDVAVQANSLFEACGHSERISLLRGFSYGVSLPEPADVLITETIGNDPLEERILDVVDDARARMLKDGARVIPASVDVYAQAFQIPEEEVASLTIGPDLVRRWKDAYGIDFEPVRQITDATARQQGIAPHRARRWHPVSDPVRLFRLDLAAPVPLAPEAVMDLPADGPRPNGILVFFEAQLSPSVRLSTRPADLKEDTSWTSPLWLLPARGTLPGVLYFRVESRRKIRLDWAG
jgi:hypothetical protein